jgi:hypothetical protein
VPLRQLKRARNSSVELLRSSGGHGASAPLPRYGF